MQVDGCETPPHEDPVDEQYGTVPGSGPGNPTARAPVPVNPLVHGHLRGTAAELRQRNGAAPVDIAAHPSSTNLRSTLNKQDPETHLLAPVKSDVESAAEESDPDDVAFFDELAAQPKDQRLLALEPYVFGKHARDNYAHHMQVKDLQEQIDTVMGVPSAYSARVHKYNMSVLSSPSGSPSKEPLLHDGPLPHGQNSRLAVRTALKHSVSRSLTSQDVHTRNFALNSDTELSRRPGEWFRHVCLVPHPGNMLRALDALDQNYKVGPTTKRSVAYLATPQQLKQMLGNEIAKGNLLAYDLLKNVLTAFSDPDTSTKELDLRL